MLVLIAPAEVGVGLAVATAEVQLQFFHGHEWGWGWSGGAIHKHFFVWFVEEVNHCSGTGPLGGLASGGRWLLAGRSGSVVTRVGLKFKGHANCGVEAVLQGVASGCGARGWHGGGRGRMHGGSLQHRCIPCWNPAASLGRSSFQPSIWTSAAYIIRVASAVCSANSWRVEVCSTTS